MRVSVWLAAVLYTEAFASSAFVLLPGCAGPPFTACDPGVTCDLPDAGDDAAVFAAREADPADVELEADAPDSIDAAPLDVDADPPTGDAAWCAVPAFCGTLLVHPPLEYCVLTSDGDAAVRATPAACGTCATYTCACGIYACSGYAASACVDPSVGVGSVRVTCQ